MCFEPFKLFARDDNIGRRIGDVSKRPSQQRVMIASGIRGVRFSRKKRYLATRAGGRPLQGGKRKPTEGRWSQ